MSLLSIHRNETEKAVVLSVHGQLDAHTSPDLEREISTLVSENKVSIVINGEKLEYISSAGLGVFMVFLEEIREKGGDIKFAALQPKVFTVFDLLGFPMLFTIAETEAEAVATFA